LRLVGVVLPACVSGVLLALPAAAHGETAAGRIVTPATGEREAPGIAAGDQLRAVLELALPLTPPPGVQQPRIWKGWSVALLREAAMSFEGASTRLEYPARVLRIRPTPGGRYRLEALTLPWMAPGLYDLRVAGPGFEHTSRASVWVGGRPVGCVVDVVVPAGVQGVEARIGGRAVRPSHVAWTTLPGPSGAQDRVLVFQAGGSRCDGAKQSGVEISAAPPGEGPVVRIRRLPDGDPLDPVEWYRLAVETDGEPPVSVIWDLGDGEWGAGPVASHRWMFSDSIAVRAVVFDARGRPGEAIHSARVGRPLARGGCSCAIPGAGREGGPLWRLLEIVLSGPARAE